MLFTVWSECNNLKGLHSKAPDDEDSASDGNSGIPAHTAHSANVSNRRYIVHIAYSLYDPSIILILCN